MNRNVIVTGPQGSGKNIKAREIAASIGTYVEVVADDMLARFGPDQLLSAPQAVIVDEVSSAQWGKLQARLKSWIVSKEITINVKHRPSVRVPTPNFILITSDLSTPNLLESERRFRIIDCGKRSA